MKSDKRPGVGVGIALIKDNKILLGHRHPNAKKASSALHGQGTWTMPGGKTEFRERLVDTAIRELFEETAIKVKEADLEFLCVQDDIEKDAHFVTVGFLAKKWKGEVKVCEPDKITEWKWWNIKKLPKPMYKPSGKMTKTYLKSRSLK